LRVADSALLAPPQVLLSRDPDVAPAADAQELDAALQRACARAWRVRRDAERVR
jgi:hypothetical protein